MYSFIHSILCTQNMSINVKILPMSNIPRHHKIIANVKEEIIFHCLYINVRRFEYALEAFMMGARPQKFLRDF